MGLTAQMIYLFLILIDVAWLLSGKTVKFHFFFLSHEGILYQHPLQQCGRALFLRCGYFMTVKWYLNFISFPQLSVSSIYIYVPWPQDLLLRHLFSHISCSGFPGGSVVKNLPKMQETLVQSLGWEDSLEKGMAIHSSIVAWRIPWIEGPWGREESDTAGVTEHICTHISCSHLLCYLLFFSQYLRVLYFIKEKLWMSEVWYVKMCT